MLRLLWYSINSLHSYTYKETAGSLDSHYCIPQSTSAQIIEGGKELYLCHTVKGENENVLLIKLTFTLISKAFLINLTNVFQCFRITFQMSLNMVVTLFFWKYLNNNSFRRKYFTLKLCSEIYYSTCHQNYRCYFNY